MKISIVEGEKAEIKYVAAGPEKLILVEDFADFAGNNSGNRCFGWKTDAGRETISKIMKKLYTEARYDYDQEGQNIDAESVSSGIYAGKKERGKVLFHLLPEFWQYPDPLSLLGEKDVSLRMNTPHYQIYCLNLHLQGEDGSKELPLYLDQALLKDVTGKPVKEKINRIEVITNFNISSTLAELVTVTLPYFKYIAFKDTAVKAILTQTFDHLLAPYQKPTKFN